jgi:cytochrome c biogenesis factor
MNKNLLILIGMMVIVGFTSALLTYFRSEKMAPPADIASKGLAAVQKGNVIFYGLFMPVLVGLISFYVYRGILARSPEAAQTMFLSLAVGLGIVLTILAAVVFKMRGFFEMTTLHILYIASFGWLRPLLWVK